MSLWLLVAWLPGSAWAQRGAPTEAQVMAAYLHKFPGFVDWPAGSFAGPASPIVIGVAGAAEVLEDLARIAAGRTVQGRPVEVRAVALSTPAAELHVLFAGRELGPAAGALLALCRDRPVLCVTDGPWDPATTALHFVVRDERVRFEASLAAAQRVGLRLSARLLDVALRVVETAP